MPYFKYKEKLCYYEEHGEGKPLLLLHGNSASSNMFYNLFPAFAKKYKTVLIDFLGHGKSERVTRLEPDLWFDEAQQVIAFLAQSQYTKVNLLGSSGGALVALNVALERPDLVEKVIADSFEGETPLEAFVKNVKEDREASKKDENAAAFYSAMQGDDWEQIVDLDTNAIFEHAQTIGKFFHKPLNTIQAEVLLVGSLEDEFVRLVSPDFYRQTYTVLIQKMGRGSMYLFEHGGHPAALSNGELFVKASMDFLNA